MDLPNPPEDPELKNIIDKLANFVARNGPEFEQMTKQKQNGNPKFSFLFGGEHFNYYQYKVTTEQAIMNQQKKQLPPTSSAAVLGMTPTSSAPFTMMPPASVSQPPPGIQTVPVDPQMQQILEQLEAQKKAAVDQIKQSEQNLAAQYQSLISQQQVQIDESIQTAQQNRLVELSGECSISINEFEEHLQPIIDSCTKEAISNGKNWIFNHNLSQKHGELTALVLLKKATDKDPPFTQRLHIIYLINDVLHHCLRKNAGELKKSLEKVVVPIYCCALNAVPDEDKKSKLLKLLNLWDQNKYFEEETISLLKDPVNGVSKYQAGLITEYGSIVTKITDEVNQRYQSLQKQHNDFANHLNSQVAQLDSHYQQMLIEQQQQQQQQQAFCSVPIAVSSQGDPISTQSFGVPVSFSQEGIPSSFNQPPPGFPTQAHMGPAPQQFDYSHGQRGQAPIVQDYNHGQQHGAPLPPIELPDLSRPPPGFPPLHSAPQPPQLNEADLMPTVPYYELPAGLMAPLVNLDDSDYKPLDPKDIRLPPPQPPSERLLAAVEAFYSAPSHERPRDSEGWEKLGLFEFFKAKQKAKKLKEENQREQQRPSSPSTTSSDSDSPPRRRYRSTSASDSPLPYQRSSRSRSKSPSPARSPPPARKKVAKDRSPTPPSFYHEPFYANNDGRLNEANKGHQLLKKMGWGGGGLGAKEQGRADPVEAGDQRDRVDMFKGLGMNMNDPFEQFRKSRSQTFTQRMRMREPN